MMLMSKHSSSIYSRCKSTVLAFTLSVTVMLLTDITSAPDDESIGIEYCQKCIADTCANTQKVLPSLLVAISIQWH